MTSWLVCCLLGAILAVVLPGSAAAAPSERRQAGTWTTIAGTARFSHTATLLRNGKVLVAGGCLKADLSGCSTGSRSAELYDPAEKSWSSAAPLGAPRLGHTATLLRTGKVLVAGGCAKGAGGNCSATNEAKSAELYDPAADKWTPTAPMTVEHFSHTASLLLSGEVLAVGTGTPKTAAPSQDNAEVYDPVKGSWRVVAPAQYARTNHSATLLRSNKVLVVGGAFQAVGSGFSASELYDPATNAWQPTLAEPSPPNGFHTATLLRSGEVLIAGGLRFDKKQSTEIYDPKGVSDPANPEIKAGSWRTADPLINGRLGHTASLLPSGQVLVIGGTAAAAPGVEPLPGTRLASAELYDPVSNKWTSAGAMQSARSTNQAAPGPPAFTATVLADGRVLVVGGAYKAGGGEVASIGRRPVPIRTAELYTPAGYSAPRATKARSFAIPLGLAALLVLSSVAALVLWARRRSQRGTSV